MSKAMPEKKEVVETPAWQACRHLWARAGMCYGSAHRGSMV
jgi:hypothetical protein